MKNVQAQCKKSFGRTRVRILTGTIFGQTSLTTRPNSGLPGLHSPEYRRVKTKTLQIWTIKVTQTERSVSIEWVQYVYYQSRHNLNFTFRPLKIISFIESYEIKFTSLQPIPSFFLSFKHFLWYFRYLKRK
jgi:hypothetical protein